MTAAELLRRLDAVTAPCDEWALTQRERCERVAVWKSTRKLLTLLAGLVEACEGLSEPGTLGIYAACVRVNEALAALNAAAAKEVM